MRLIHTSDLHLGRRFGQMPEELRGRLTEARHGAIGRLAGLARAQGAALVAIAGDMFDAATPAPRTLRQALTAMAEAADLTWAILPGNHDPLAADALWPRIAAEGPANVRPLLAPAPVALAGLAILPAPCTTKRPGRDLTAWMEGAATPEGLPRLGLAHGAVQDFGEDGAHDTIPPDRAARAGLDYLALGDWHGQVRLDARSWYSGTPEPDRFRHDAPGRALLVDLPGPGAVPVVTPLETGAFRWRTVRLDLLPGEDPAARLAGLLPPRADRRMTLLRVAAAGRLRPGAEAALLRAAAEAEPDFALMELDRDGLSVEHAVEDLDLIDRAGALRRAAEALLAEARDPALSAADRAVAAAALSRLHAFVAEGG